MGTASLTPTINVTPSENLFEGFARSYTTSLILTIPVGVAADINVVVVVEMHYLTSLLIIACFVEKKLFREHVQ